MEMRCSDAVAKYASNLATAISRGVNATKHFTAPVMQVPSCSGNGIQTKLTESRILGLLRCRSDSERESLACTCTLTATRNPTTVDLLAVPNVL